MGINVEAIAKYLGDQLYGLILPDKLESDNPKNIHVVTVSCSEGKVTRVSPKTLCGCKKKKITNGEFLVKCVSASKLRTIMAKKQNEGDEICGRCVAAMYADQGD